MFSEFDTMLSHGLKRKEMEPEPIPISKPSLTKIFIYLQDPRKELTSKVLKQNLKSSLAVADLALVKWDLVYENRPGQGQSRDTRVSRWTIRVNSAQIERILKRWRTQWGQSLAFTKEVSSRIKKIRAPKRMRKLTDPFKKVKSRQIRNLEVVSFNVCGLRSNIDILRFIARREKPDLFLIQETRLSDMEAIPEIPKYEVVGKPNRQGGGPGLAIYHKEDLSLTEVSSAMSITTEFFQIVRIDQVGKDSEGGTLICNCYIPSRTSGISKREAALRELQIIDHDLGKNFPGDRVIHGGDFNLIKSDMESLVLPLFPPTSELAPNKVPTFVRAGHADGTILDYFIVSDPGLVRNKVTVLSDMGRSRRDHLPIMIDLNVAISTSPTLNMCPPRINRRITTAQLRTIGSHAAWSELDLTSDLISLIPTVLQAHIDIAKSLQLYREERPWRSLQEQKRQELSKRPVFDLIKKRARLMREMTATLRKLNESVAREEIDSLEEKLVDLHWGKRELNLRIRNQRKQERITLQQERLEEIAQGQKHFQTVDILKFIQIQSGSNRHKDQGIQRILSKDGLSLLSDPVDLTARYTEYLQDLFTDPDPRPRTEKLSHLRETLNEAGNSQYERDTHVNTHL